MEMKKFILPLIIFVGFINLYAQSNLFVQLKEKTALKQNEFLVIAYFQLGNCSKCLIEPFEIINQIEKSRKATKVKFVALVKCDREIELKIFTRESDWKYFTYVDDGTARNNLGAEPSAIVSILNYNGTNILNCKKDDIRKNIKKINEFLSKD